MRFNFVNKRLLISGAKQAAAAEAARKIQKRAAKVINDDHSLVMTARANPATRTAAINEGPTSRKNQRLISQRSKRACVRGTPITTLSAFNPSQTYAAPIGP